MMPALRMTTDQYEKLYAHLFNGDGLEAAAILICGLAGRHGDQLLVHHTLLIPYDACVERTATRLTWPGECLDQAIDEADMINGSVILLHSHPGGLFDFSALDDESDQTVIPCLQNGGKNEAALHGSAIMVPDGRIRARVYDENMRSRNIDCIKAIGHDIRDLTRKLDDRPLAYSSAMTSDLSRQSAVVVGVSGTGSIVAEMLARLGVGRIVLIDFDTVEEKNLNRILYATPGDIGRFKTHLLRDAITAHHPDTVVETFETLIADIQALLTASEADILFSCVDSMEGRHYCDLMVAAFLCPLIDVGVTIPTRRRNAIVEIADVCGRIDFVRPGGASLWDRGEITGEGLAAEYVRRTNPDDHARQLAEGYIKGVPEEAPSVISLNMRAASAAVNEWLARIYAVRHDSNVNYSRTYFSLASGEEEFAPEPTCSSASQHSLFARGLMEPLLGLPNLTQTFRTEA
ncbi:ThiF family adenylyltransferase [Hyphomonas sp. NPDC076900]|uniref:ThiF family adenylyltransferase n=1 Tax=unclassified Hyphomonas TaxID=2630699 RepID=UPI003CFD1AAC